MDEAEEILDVMFPSGDKAAQTTAQPSPAHPTPAAPLQRAAIRKTVASAAPELPAAQAGTAANVMCGGNRIYNKWLNEDVLYIISPPERTAFESLRNVSECDAFVEQFWSRRNPLPGSAENAFKAEHYRRIAYANVHFGSSEKPGWRADRGRIYITYGPPDQKQIPYNASPGSPKEVWSTAMSRSTEYRPSWRSNSSMSRLKAANLLTWS